MIIISSDILFRKQSKEFLLPQNAGFARTPDYINIDNDNHCVCLSGNVRQLLFEDKVLRHNKCEELLPECKCSNYKGIYPRLTCQKVRDFEAFDHILSNGSVFQVNSTFKITLSGNTVLPKGFLSGLIVDRLSVDDFQTQRVEEDAFDGVLELIEIFVKKSSMKEIPDFRAIHSSLRTLRLDNSRITQLRGDNLKNLTRLSIISFVNNSIEHVADDVFQGTESVTSFDISYNLLTFLPPRLFKSWKYLEVVRLSYNQLLHVDHLFLGRTRGQLCLKVFFEM
ncbi:uncharacterized protein CEXT_499371 [Caerostris extrusa]|uniref:Uncharacterized protein n=1 Tax=Caerostris extrusa TaxID=172846 RepID=A0AAV4SEI6_CAEEX|nr:uncharacterized protein CEXT_499371 [Caerostris extrusa]